MADNNAMDRIRNATLEIIAKDGFHDITSRKIAAYAGVNHAAINYYFGSKDKVINDVLESLLSSLKEAFTHLNTHDISPKARLKNFLAAYKQGIFQYPDLIRNFIYQSVKSNCASNYQHFLATDGSKALQQTLIEATGCNQCDARIKAMLLIGAIIFPALIGHMTETIFCIDMDDHELNNEYINAILQAVLSSKNI